MVTSHTPQRSATYRPAISHRVIDRLLDGDEGHHGPRECLLEVCQRTADRISKAGGGPGEGQTVHISDDNKGDIAGIAVNNCTWMVSSR
jgi:hypothetical protein